MSTHSSLPDPDDAVGSDVVIWDGQCNFCRSQVERLRSLDWRGQLSYLSLHDSRVPERYPELSHAALLEQMWVATRTGEKYGGADAGRYLSRQLPALWWLAPLLHLPGSMPLWRWMYRQIAERRYRLSGKSCDTEDSCQVHLNPSRSVKQKN